MRTLRVAWEMGDCGSQLSRPHSFHPTRLSALPPPEASTWSGRAGGGHSPLSEVPVPEYRLFADENPDKTLRGWCLFCFLCFCGTGVEGNLTWASCIKGMSHIPSLNFVLF